MMKIKSSIFLLTLLLTVSLVAQDSFVRSTVIDPPSTYPSGFGATVSGVDLDGDGKLEIYSVNGMSDYAGDEIPGIIKYELNGTSWDSVWAATLPNERQNSWAALTIGDLDGDGKQEIIWGLTNNLAVNQDPPRIVVFETNGDDVLGVSDGAGNFAPNAQWNLGLAAGSNVRPLKWFAFDIDNDGKQEVVFAGRQNTTTMGVISVTDVPDAGGATEVWTLEMSNATELTDQFLRMNVIDSPDGGFGGIVSDVDFDGDGLMDLYIVNDNWGDGPNGELIPTLYKYELVSGAFVERWSTVLPGVNYQNTWPVLTSGDLDGDGLGEIIWCPINNFGTGNEDYPRIVVYETPSDSSMKASDIMGIDNGDGTLSPNSKWNMGVPASTSMRPFRGQVADIDNDGKQEFIFAERHGFYGWGVASVDNIPSINDGSETWTMETAGANMLASKELNIKFDDDADVTNWSHFNDANVYTTEAWDTSGALVLGDAGYAMLAKRPLMATVGATYNLSMDIKTENWNDSATYPIYVTVDMLDADPDTIYVNNSDTGYVSISFTGVAVADAGYIKIVGSNTLLANLVWVDNVVYTLDDGSPAVSSNYRDLAVSGQNMYIFESSGKVTKVDGSDYSVGTPFQAYSGWSWLSAGAVDIDGDGTEEIYGGNYNTSGGAVYVFTPDADSLIGYMIADFSATTSTKVTSIRHGKIDADTLVDFAVGFRGTDEIYLVSYQGGDVTSSANYTVKLMEKGVLGSDGVGQMDAMFVANIDKQGGDEVLYAGVPRSIDANKQPLTIGSFSDVVSADGGGRWDVVIANGKAHFFDGSGNLQSIYSDGTNYKLTKSQPALVNGAFLSASATDVDGDGTEEILVGNWYDAKVNMLKWVNGAWVATEVADFTADGGARLNGGAVGDIDGDGNVDFVTGSRGSVPNGQIYRVEYTGGDIMDAGNWSASVIDAGMNDLFSQYEVVNISNLDADADLEVLYTSDYARGPNSATDAPFPIVILDLQKIIAETIAAVKVDADNDFNPDRLGEVVIIKGVVTTPDYNLSSSSSISIYIQDETGGINLYAKPKLDPALEVGDLIQVTGEVAFYNGLTELVVNGSDTTIVKLGKGTVPTPMVVTIADIMENGEMYESSLVKVKAIANTGNGDAWPVAGSNANVNMTDGYMDFTMRVDKDVDMAGQVEPVGPMDVVGVLTQFSTDTPANNGYQILPRMYSDISQNVKAAPSPYFFFTDETRAYDGKVMNIDDSTGVYQVSWHPSVDLNGDALLYQFVLLNAADGALLIEEMSDNGGADTTISPTGTDIIELIQKTGTDSLQALMAVRTTDLTTGVIASVDTLMITFKDLATGLNGTSFIPKEFFVDQNYPNPFNPTTTIQFGLPAQAEVNLIIYDILGREVARLVNNQVMSAGVYKFNFNASQLASGTYIYRLQADKKVEVKKMLLLK